MKASEVVKRYQQRERDFRRVNLRGQFFKGKDLSGADFSEADIRGTNFKGAILRGANFTGAKCGLQRRWAIVLVIVSLLLGSLSGLISAVAGVIAGSALSSGTITNVLGGIITLTMLAIFFIVTIRQGLEMALGTMVVVMAIGVGFGVTLARVLTVVWVSGGVGAGARDLAVTVGLTVAGAGAAVVAGAGAIAIVAAGVEALAWIVAGAVTAIGAMVWAIAVAVAVAWGRAQGLIGVGSEKGALPVVWTVAVAVAGVGVLLGSYIGYRSLFGDEKFARIREFMVAFAATGGTSFYNADLTDADFTGATLKSTDLRAKSLTRACWKDTVKLDLARVGQTLLSQKEVRELLVSGSGYNTFYRGKNLRGANLAGADLNKANLKFADLSEATLADANLDGANLTEVSAVGTDFTRASMTGACLEAWNIESSTKLDQVDCQYVYLLENPKPKTDDRERRPSSGVFQPGEFTKLFEEVLDTVDLIFRNGVDWKAFVAAFKKVQVENEDTPLEIQGIENKGDGVVVVKVKVPPDTDKEKIHQDFTQNYELALKEVEAKYKAELAAKDKEIGIYRQKSADMMEIVKLQASRPINIEAKAVLDSKFMSNSIDQSSKIEIGGDFTDSNLNISEISKTVTNSLNQLSASPDPNQPGIKELLAELQAAIAADTNLDDEDQAEALEQVGTLAEAGKNPSDGAMKKAAKTAMKILRGTVASLPTATKLVEEFNKLLPAIANIFGL